MGYTVDKKLIEENENKLLGAGRSFEDLREAMEFFASPAARRVRPSAIEKFYRAKDKAEIFLKAMGLSPGEGLPDDPALIKIIWNDQYLTKRKLLREIFTHENIAKKIEIPLNSTIEELGSLLKEIKHEALRLKNSKLEKNKQQLLTEIEASRPRVYTGPRGGKYRINSNGRKSYDVP